VNLASTDLADDGITGLGLGNRAPGAGAVGGRAGHVLEPIWTVSPDRYRRTMPPSLDLDPETLRAVIAKAEHLRNAPHRPAAGLTRSPGAIAG
jgi:hypothetical protein